MRRQSLIVCWAVLASLAYLGQGEAGAPDGGEKHGNRRGPPPEAIQACNGLEDGAACSFTLHERQISGLCRARPEGKPAVCAPNPRPEALQACSGLEQGAPCNFTYNGNQISGTCRGPQGKPAACRPNYWAPKP